MSSSISKSIIKNIINIPGWRTKRKIVVIESDDWGSIRMPSLDVYKSLIKRGVKIDNLAYNRFDALASDQDLEMLFDVLSKIKDINNCSPLITANTIVANPDFERIRESEFQNYYFEPFPTTLSRYPEHKNAFNLWKEGIEAGIFKPQFHGREHLNVKRWMSALQSGDKQVLEIFDLGMYDLSISAKITEHSFMDAYNIQSSEDITAINESIKTGLELFHSLFGYLSDSFIAPSYIWPGVIEDTLIRQKVKIAQGAHYRLEPLPGLDNNFRKSYHFTGQQSKKGLKYIVRNARFEPSEIQNFPWIDDIISRAKNSFYWGKPLVIGSHRLNYIGYIDPANRDKNLILLSSLLNSLQKKWPDIEFMSTDKLGSIINSENK